MRIIKIIYNDMQKNEVVFSTHNLQSMRISNGVYGEVLNKCWIYFDLPEGSEILPRVPEHIARNAYEKIIDYLSNDCGSVVIKLLRADGEEVTDIMVKNF